MIDEMLERRAAEVLGRAREAGLMIATVESCTGGMLAAALTAIAGSSAVVERGFVTYSNEAKNETVGVPMDLIMAHGAVSEPVARAMAEGGLAHSRAQLCVGITGVAGPGGGTAEKPVGLVHFGAARSGRPTLHARHVFDGDRTAIRHAAVVTALDLFDTLVADQR